jgi:hypothetical protein
MHKDAMNTEDLEGEAEKRRRIRLDGHPIS